MLVEHNQKHTSSIFHVLSLWFSSLPLILSFLSLFHLCLSHLSSYSKYITNLFPFLPRFLLPFSRKREWEREMRATLEQCCRLILIDLNSSEYSMNHPLHSRRAVSHVSVFRYGNLVIFSVRANLSPLLDCKSQVRVGSEPEKMLVLFSWNITHEKTLSIGYVRLRESWEIYTHVPADTYPSCRNAASTGE